MYNNRKILLSLVATGLGATLLLTGCSPDSGKNDTNSSVVEQNAEDNKKMVEDNQAKPENLDTLAQEANDFIRNPEVWVTMNQEGLAKLPSEDPSVRDFTKEQLSDPDLYSIFSVEHQSDVEATVLSIREYLIANPDAVDFPDSLITNRYPDAAVMTIMTNPSGVPFVVETVGDFPMDTVTRVVE